MIRAMELEEPHEVVIVVPQETEVPQEMPTERPVPAVAPAEPAEHSARWLRAMMRGAQPW